jgi:hypothetical protein
MEDATTMVWPLGGESVKRRRMRVFEGVGTGEGGAGVGVEGREDVREPGIMGRKTSSAENRTVMEGGDGSCVLEKATGLGMGAEAGAEAEAGQGAKKVLGSTEAGAKIETAVAPTGHRRVIPEEDLWMAMFGGEFEF